MRPLGQRADLVERDFSAGAQVVEEEPLVLGDHRRVVGPDHELLVHAQAAHVQVQGADGRGDAIDRERLGVEESRLPEPDAHSSREQRLEVGLGCPPRHLLVGPRGGHEVHLHAAGGGVDQRVERGRVRHHVRRLELDAVARAGDRELVGARHGVPRVVVALVDRLHHDVAGRERRVRVVRRARTGPRRTPRTSACRTASRGRPPPDRSCGCRCRATPGTSCRRRCTPGRC